MRAQDVAGKSIIFHFSDGPMADKAFQHDFGRDGTLRFHPVDSDQPDAEAGQKSDGDATALAYESAPVGRHATVLSYFSPGSHYTLTVTLDFETQKLVAFSSNDKGVSLQHGTFELAAKQQMRRAS